MSDDMIKKTADIPQQDKKFLDEEVTNFSSEIRRFLGIEKLARMDKYDLEQIQEDIKKTQKIGQEVRKQWREKQQNLLEEYNAEKEAEDRQGIHFKMEDGGLFTAYWNGEVLQASRKHPKTDKAQELGDKLNDQWWDAIDQWHERIDEETELEHEKSTAENVVFSTQYDGVEFICDYVTKNSVIVTVDDGDTKRTYRPDLVLNYQAVY